ncbi:hypothetical protein E4T38_03472 [Aureobasidium subglaciale]|nr:hypothetical protein E4T38_03472 [Aureobasidium subglaciale]KAI5226209.1 hypothetical protein E4T40_03150 [Aureobasidium subglaciale]KAI5229524.1 hypothetical protein E4T41_03469 [Aureobasidium subglaciale]KAI5264231.1 hypothetical protein E4T46_03246 [Aureobasidium subglaciale]
MAAERDPKQNAASAVEDDDEPDDWDKRIFSTGCSDGKTKTLKWKTVENTRLNDCFFEKKDWRQCKSEMEEFKQCWKKQGNDRRTDQKNV